jgi:hypothetical protein
MIEKMKPKNPAAGGPRAIGVHSRLSGAKKAIARAGRLVILAALVGCSVVQHAPQDRARAFIEAAVTTPSDSARLAAAAGLPPGRRVDDLYDGLAVRVALDFLQAKQAQGVGLEFKADAPQRLDPQRWRVGVRVRYAADAGSGSGEVRFEVYLRQDEPDRWRIDRVVAGETSPGHAS